MFKFHELSMDPLTHYNCKHSVVNAYISYRIAQKNCVATLIKHCEVEQYEDLQTLLHEIDLQGKTKV